MLGISTGKDSGNGSRRSSALKVIALLAVLVVSVSVYTTYWDEFISEVELMHLRRSLQHHGHVHKDDVETIATVKIDFYRTFKKTLFGIGPRNFSMSKARCKNLVKMATHWFGHGKVQFELGDIHDYDNERMYKVDAQNCYRFATDIALNDNRILRKDRFNIIGSHFLGGLLSCDGSGTFRELPQVILPTQDSFTLLNNSTKAAVGVMVTSWRSWGGGSMAQAMGHLMGLHYTSEDVTRGVRTYRRCGLLEQYPFFATLENPVTGQKPEKEFMNSGQTWNVKDWPGTTNIMSRFTIPNLIGGFVSGKIGIFMGNYAAPFEQIIRCYFHESGGFGVPLPLPS